MSTAGVKIAFDTHAYVRTLKNAGFSETKAEGLSDGLAVAMTQGVATHDDIVGLDGRIDTLDAKIEALDAKIDHVHENLNSKIDHVQGNLNSKIDYVQENLNSKIDGAINKAVIQLGMFMVALVTLAVAVLSFVIVHHK